MQPLYSAVHSRGQSVLKFRKCLYHWSVQIPQDLLGTSIWPLFDCFGTPLNNDMAARTSCEINLLVVITTVGRWPCKRYALVLLLIEEFVNFCENNLTVDNLDALLLPAFPAGFLSKWGARQALAPRVEVSTLILNTLHFRLFRTFWHFWFAIEIKNKYQFSLNHNESIKK